MNYLQNEPRYEGMRSARIRRWSVRVFASAVLAFGGYMAPNDTARAQTDYPTRAIKIVNPFAPGGNTDIIARLVAAHLHKAWGQPVVVENREGAGGTIGTDAVARAAPDGYTLLLATLAATAIAPSVHPKLPYDPLKDFAPIIGMTIGYSVLGVSPKLPVKTLKELIDYAKARPGELMFSSPGAGVSSHLAMENFGHVTNTKLVHVPYRGSAPALAAVMAGDVQMSFDPISTMAPLVLDGKIRPIAVAGPKRSPKLPDVPTTTEAGEPAIQSAAWTGLMAPAGTPPAIIEKIQNEVAKMLQSQDFRDRMEKLATEVLDMPADKFAAYVKSETEAWGQIAKRVKSNAN